MCSCFGDVDTFVRVDSLNQLYGTWVRDDNQLVHFYNNIDEWELYDRLKDPKYTI